MSDRKPEDAYRELPDTGTLLDTIKQQIDAMHTIAVVMLHEPDIDEVRLERIERDLAEICALTHSLQKDIEEVPP